MILYIETYKLEPNTNRSESKANPTQQSEPKAEKLI